MHVGFVVGISLKLRGYVGWVAELVLGSCVGLNVGYFDGISVGLMLRCCVVFDGLLVGDACRWYI